MQWFHSTHLCVPLVFHKWDWSLLHPAKKHQAGERSLRELPKPRYPPWLKPLENLSLHFPKQPELNPRFSVLIPATHFSYRLKIEDVLPRPTDRTCQALLPGVPSHPMSLLWDAVSLAGQKLGTGLTKPWGHLAAPGSRPGCSGLGDQLLPQLPTRGAVGNTPARPNASRGKAQLDRRWLHATKLSHRTATSCQ